MDHGFNMFRLVYHLQSKLRDVVTHFCCRNVLHAHYRVHKGEANQGSLGSSQGRSGTTRLGRQVEKGLIYMHGQRNQLDKEHFHL